MKRYNTDWSKANQQYLSGMLKLLRERIGNHAMAVNDVDKDNEIADPSVQENELR